MSRLRLRIIVVAISATSLCFASMAPAAPREHDSTLSVRLLGLPEIVVKAKPGVKLNVGADKSIQVPASMFAYTGTLVPDFRDDQIPFTFAGKGTHLDTRLLRSVQVSLRNRAATLKQGGFIRNGIIAEWGGVMPLTGEFRMKFRPYVKKLGNVLVTTTPADATIPASIIGQERGNAEAVGGTPANLGGMRFWYLGKPWRTGNATTFIGSATYSVLNQATPDGDTGVVFRSYINPNNPNPTYPHVRQPPDGTKGQPFIWDAADPDGYGSVTVVSPMAIHHQELRSDLLRARLYTLRSFATLSIEIMPTQLGVAFEPSLKTGVPTLAGALGFTLIAIARRRR